MKRLTTHCAQTAITAGLGIALALGNCPVSGYARGGQASITVMQQNNADATYQAYQVFAADVSAKDEATHVTWPSADMRDIVLAFLKSEGYENWLTTRGLAPVQAAKAQNALEFVAQEIGSSRIGESPSTGLGLVGADSFATRFARYLVAHDAPCRLATAGAPFSGEEGYWLFVTQTASINGADEAATAPIWITLGGSAGEVREKSAIPKVTKLVKEDATAAWGTAADANRGQDVPYQLVGTLPSNFAAYSHYHYRFEDRLSDGLELALEAGAEPSSVVKVKVGDEVVDADGTNLSITWVDHKLCIDFADLASAHWDDLHIDAHTTITVEYQAHLTENAIIGSSGNENGVIVRYSNDPLGDGEGQTTPPPSPKLFTYALRLMKVDKQTEEPLSGAGFTIQVAEGNADMNSRGLYVQEDGSLGTEPHEFVTGRDGTLSVEGIDEGIYVIAEKTAPTGYEQINRDITVTLSSTLGSSPASLDGLSVRVTGIELSGASEADAPSSSSADPQSGVATLTVTNDKSIVMPLTGLAGIRGGGIGALVAAASSALLWVRRRHAA